MINIIIISVQQLLFPLPSFTFLISIFLFFSCKRQKFRDIGCKKCAFLALCKKKKKWLQFRYDLNNYARMHTLIMKIHNNHLLFRTSKVQIKINQSEMTTKHHIFKLILQGSWLKGLWHQYRFENKVWVLGPLCDHLIGRNSISKSAASKSYKRL